jgi:hypothetical protein
VNEREGDLANFHFAPEFIFVKVKGGDVGLTGRSVCYFLTNLFILNLKGRKPKSLLIFVVSHSIPSLSTSAQEHSVSRHTNILHHIPISES